MHHKNIKLIVRKQLKKQFPDWKRLPKKDKKELARKVLAEVVAEYDFKQKINTPVDQLLAIEGQHPARGIIKLDEMARLIEKVNSTKIIKFSNYVTTHPYQHLTQGSYPPKPFELLPVG